jgi:hypothetical protein
MQIPMPLKGAPGSIPMTGTGRPCVPLPLHRPASLLLPPKRRCSTIDPSTSADAPQSQASQSTMRRSGLPRPCGSVVSQVSESKPGAPRVAGRFTYPPSAGARRCGGGPGRRRGRRRGRASGASPQDAAAGPRSQPGTGRQRWLRFLLRARCVRRGPTG